MNGQQYRDLPRPCTRSARCWRRGRCTPAAPATTICSRSLRRTGSRGARIDEVIELVGLESVARKRVGGFSLGMGQRLGVAAALLGDPATVILDEPANGLDPEGIRWIRNLLKGLAAEGRTVFLSSHLMSEMEQTAEHLIVIGRGRLIADTDVASFVAQASAGAPVRVRAPAAAALAEAVSAAGGATRHARGRRPAGLRPDRRADRGDRCRAPARAARADADAGLARGRVHEPHQGLGRIPAFASTSTHDAAATEPVGTGAGQ